MLNIWYETLHLFCVDERVVVVDDERAMTLPSLKYKITRSATYLG